MKKVNKLSYIILILVTACNFSGGNVEKRIDVKLSVPRSGFNTESITLTVDAPDLPKAVYTASNTDSIAISVATGLNRTFTIEITLIDGQTLSGSSTVNITSSTVVVNIDISYDSILSTDIPVEDILVTEISITSIDPSDKKYFELSVDITSRELYTVGDDVNILMNSSTSSTILRHNETDYTGSLTPPSITGNILTATSVPTVDGSDTFVFTFATTNSGTYVCSTAQSIPQFSGTFSAYTANNNADILSFIYDGGVGEIVGTDISIATTYITPMIMTSLGSTVSPESYTSQEFMAGESVKYTVTAQDGTIKVYTVTAVMDY